MELIRLLLMGLCCTLATAVHHCSFIVEARPGLSLSTEQLVDELAELAVEQDGAPTSVTKRSDFRSALFEGFSMDVVSHGITCEHFHQLVMRHDAIQNVWRSTGPARDAKQAPAKRSAAAGVSSLTPGNNAHLKRDALAALPQHIQVGIDRLHATGIKGKGIKIAILDTGFDYKQETFGYEIGPGKKLGYGHDWTVDAAKDKWDADDPYVDCSHHGTHVLGIVAADPTRFGVVGAAPEATIELHRVFDCDGHVDDDILFEALSAAWERDVDVINCSWGMSNPHDSAISALAARIMKNGTYVQFTAGNEGPRPLTLSMPGASHGVPAVGSVDSMRTPAYFWNGTIVVDGKEGTIRWVPGLTNKTVTEFSAGLAVWAPFERFPGNPPYHPEAAPMNLSIPDMDEHVLLIRSDFFSFHQKLIVDEIKPKYVLIYHCAPDDLVFPGLYFPSWPITEIPDTRALALVEYQIGIDMVREIQGGKRVLVTLATSQHHEDTVVFSENYRTGGRMTGFSGWGPTVYGEGGVTFAAPGGRILSTVPRLYGGFGQLSGTSMAAPLVASVAGLIKQMHPDWTPDVIRNVLATTARPMPYTDNSTRVYDFLAPVIQQGGGLIDAYTAAHTTTLVNVSALDFLDLDHQPSSLWFSVTNTGLQNVTFGVNHIGAASGHAMASSNAGHFADDKYLEQSGLLMAKYANVQITPLSFTVPSGHSVDVRVSVTPPPEADPTRFPFYGGYIALNSTDGKQNLTVPYSGIAARLPADLPLVDARTVACASYDTETSSTSACAAGMTFNIHGSRGQAAAGSKLWPAIIFGSPLIRPRYSTVSLENVASGQSIFAQNLNHRDWQAGLLHWKVPRNLTSMGSGRYVWRLSYSGLLASEEESDRLSVLTEQFSINFGLHPETQDLTRPELTAIPCNIMPAEGY